MIIIYDYFKFIINEKNRKKISGLDNCIYSNNFFNSFFESKQLMLRDNFGIGIENDFVFDVLRKERAVNYQKLELFPVLPLNIPFL